MKRWLSLFSVLLLLALGGCATKQYTPDVTADFEQSAVVTAGDFSYHCKICRTDGTVTVTVGDTAARGMVMTCAGTMVRYRFDGMEYEARAQDLENTNPAIALYDVFSVLRQNGELQAKRRRTATNIREPYRQANLCSTRMRTVLMPHCIFSAATYSLNLTRRQNKPNACLLTGVWFLP